MRDALGGPDYTRKEVVCTIYSLTSLEIRSVYSFPRSRRPHLNVECKVNGHRDGEDIIILFKYGDNGAHFQTGGHSQCCSIVHIEGDTNS